MNTITKTDIRFDRLHCKNLLDTEQIESAKLYIKKFFFSYQNKIFYNDGINFILYSREDALKLIPNDLKISILKPNETTKKFEKQDISIKDYLKESEFLNTEYTPTIDFNKPLIFTKNINIRGHDFTDNYLNMSKPINYNVITGKQFEKTQEIINNTKLIYDHLENSLCSKNKQCFEYVLNFIACSLGGRKLRKCLYLQSKERSGKGIILNDVLKNILGSRMYKTNSIESILKYTKAFEGCCLINFDELPHSADYKGVQDNLKGLITEPTFTCRDMYSSGYDQINTFNIILTTNNDAVSLTQSNNSRYVCLDISEENIGNNEYFKLLSKGIKYEHVLENFYNDMMDRFNKICPDWNEDIMPETESRKLKIIEALPQLYKYIKEEFILRNTGIDVRTDTFLQEYKLITKDRTSPQKIGRMLKEINIVSIKLSSNKGYKYKISKEDLLKVFQEKKWIDETIDLINDDNLNIKTELDGDDENIELIKSLKKQLEEAQNKIKLLETKKPELIEVKKDFGIEIKLKTKKNKSKLIQEQTEEELEQELNKLLG